MIERVLRALSDCAVTLHPPSSSTPLPWAIPIFQRSRTAAFKRRVGRVSPASLSSQVLAAEMRASTTALALLALLPPALAGLQEVW